MIKRYLAIVTLLFTIMGTALAYNGPRGGRGNRQPQGQQTGPMDGSGPIHTPGSGDGSGSDAGRGRMTGPRDGSGPLHTPGTGGGTGAGQRRGRR